MSLKYCSRDAWTAETTRDEMARTPFHVLNVFISFRSRDDLCTLSRLLVRPGFRLFHVLVSLYFIWLFIQF